MSKSLFVVGTGTDVGKTYVTGLMLKKLHQSGRNAAYFKPAMSGNPRGEDGRLIPGDALAVKTASGIDQPLEGMCPYVYGHAYSPHLAAKLEGNPMSMRMVTDAFMALSTQYDYITVEGAGGIVCPLRFDEDRILQEDVIRALDIHCILVAVAGLGAINAVVLTAAYMQARNIPVKGIIFNRYTGNTVERDNLKMCGHITGLRVLACVSDDGELDMDADALASLYK